MGSTAASVVAGSTAGVSVEPVDSMAAVAGGVAVSKVLVVAVGVVEAVGLVAGAVSGIVPGAPIGFVTVGGIVVEVLVTTASVLGVFAEEVAAAGFAKPELVGALGVAFVKAVLLAVGSVAGLVLLGCTTSELVTGAGLSCVVVARAGEVVTGTGSEAVRSVLVPVAGVGVPATGAGLDTIVGTEPGCAAAKDCQVWRTH